MFVGSREICDLTLCQTKERLERPGREDESKITLALHSYFQHRDRALNSDMVLALHQRLWQGFDCFYLATMRGCDVMRYKPSLMCIFLFRKKETSHMKVL